MGKKRTWPWTRPDPRRAERAQLEAELARAQTQMAQAYAGFNATVDGDLTEFYIYEIQALRAQYSYLLRRRKVLETGDMDRAADMALPSDPTPQLAGESASKVLPIRPARPVA